MKYQESFQIKEQIESAQKILLNCHRNPDPDSIGSACSMNEVLERMGKDVSIISPSDIPKDLLFIPNSEIIKTVDFDTFDFSQYDLLIMMDTSSWDRVFSSKNFTVPPIPVVVIDNHETNTNFGNLNLLDFDTSSVCEMLFTIFSDWGEHVDPKIATCLMAGILGDTGSFQYEVYKDTLRIANQLLDLGIDHKSIVFYLFNSKPLGQIQFWGEVINRLKVETEGFAWAGIPFDIYQKYEHISGVRETAATMLIRKIEGTHFGFVLTEDAPGTITISFRGRTDFDVADLAKELGGGGHSAASGAHIEGVSFEDVVNKVVDVSKEKVLQHGPPPKD